MAGTASEARSLSDDLFGPFLGGPGEPGAHPSLAQAASAHLGHSGNRLLAAECLVGGSAPMPVPVPTEGSVRGGSAWPVAWGAALPDVPFGAALGDGFAGSTRGLGAARGSGGGDAGGASSGGGRAGLHSGDSSGRSGEPGGAKPASPPATSSKSFKELHAERNKQAQRRFRQRQKARECGGLPLVVLGPRSGAAGSAQCGGAGACRRRWRSCRRAWRRRRARKQSSSAAPRCWCRRCRCAAAPPVCQSFPARGGRPAHAPGPGGRAAAQGGAAAAAAAPGRAGGRGGGRAGARVRRLGHAHLPRGPHGHADAGAGAPRPLPLWARQRGRAALPAAARPRQAVCSTAPTRADRRAGRRAPLKPGAPRARRLRA